MKRLCLVFVTFFLAGSVSFGQMAGDTETLTPADVNLFVKSKEIVKLLKAFNYLVFNLMDEQQKADILTERDKFRDKTGIDYLDEKSVRNAGIDTGRPVSFANFDKDNTDEVMLIFLPVLNEKEFPLKFIEMVKKTNAGNPEMVISPVTTTYKNVTVYQVKNDLYIAPANGYLLIGSTGDIIRRVLDVRSARNGSLMLDEHYKDYLTKEKNRYDINAFVTKKFIMQMSTPSDGQNYGLYSMSNFILAQSDSGMKNLDNSSALDSIDYISAGMGFDGNKFQMNASAKLAKDNPYVDLILGFLKTGVQNKSLYVPAADSTLFMSMNLKYLDNFCKGEIEWCTQYNSFKEQLKTDMGIDFEKDFIPYHEGGINVMALDSASSGGMGDLLVFVPMSDSKKIEELWLKMRKGFQAKYGKTKKFGEEKIGGKRGFWFIDESQMRFFVSFDQRGIYAGNSTGLMKSGISSKTVDMAVNTGRFGKVINDKTFFLLNIKKNAFLKALMQMRSQGNQDIAKGINRIGEIFLFCEKRDGLISVDFEVEIKEPAKKK
jgi:hypothetical protein